MIIRLHTKLFTIIVLIIMEKIESISKLKLHQCYNYKYRLRVTLKKYYL